MTKYECDNMINEVIHLFIDAFLSGCLLVFLATGIALNKDMETPYINHYKLIEIGTLFIIITILAVINLVSIIGRSKRVRDNYENSKSSRIQDIQSKGQERED